MIADKMKELVRNSSVTRAMFEEGKKMAACFGRENVYDFSLGNPSVPAPEGVRLAMEQVIEEEEAGLVHGYMNNSGYEDVREAVAASLNKRFGTDFDAKDILMTVGAAGGLNVILKTLINPRDEIILFAPFFGEYKNYISNVEARAVIVPPNPPGFQPDLEEFSKRITDRTKAVIINSPNNPTGVIYSEETILKISGILHKKQKEFGKSIYIIADEPYRELAYDKREVPYLTKYYANTIVGYSFSKSLSLPGERIGYLVLPKALDAGEEIKAAANVANRILGFVNAPSFMQRVIKRCLDAKVDLENYNKNRELLFGELTAYGYECLKPEGAFYLFVKAKEEDDMAFAARAKAHRLLLVPGRAFDCPGYVRIAYCVDYDLIKRSLPAFRALIEEYNSL